MKTNQLMVAELSIVLLAATSTAHGSQPSFMGLGDLPGGTSASFGWGVSGDGNVVVGEFQSAEGNQAFR